MHFRDTGVKEVSRQGCALFFILVNSAGSLTLSERRSNLNTTAGPCKIIPTGHPFSASQACCPACTGPNGTCALVADESAAACSGPEGTCALWNNTGYPRCWDVGGSLTFITCNIVPAGYENEGEEVCCFEGGRVYGDGSACTGTNLCALWGNPGLLRCWDEAIGGPQPTSIESAASVTEDPHIVNMVGKRFDVLRPGLYTLVEAPRGAHPGNQSLLITVRIDQLLGTCRKDGLYVRRVDVSGSFMKEVGGPISFHTVPTDVDASDMLHVQTQQTATTSAEAFTSMHQQTYPHHMVEFTRINPRKQTLKLKFGTVRLDITGRRLAMGKEQNLIDFVDLKVAGLGGLHMEVGGMLGADDYSWATVLPDECKKVPVFLQSSSANLINRGPKLGSSLIALD